MYEDAEHNFVHTRCFTRNVTAWKLADAERQRMDAEENERRAQEQAAKLRDLNDQLAHEKRITDSLINQVCSHGNSPRYSALLTERRAAQMLPARVAADLRTGSFVPPGTVPWLTCSL